MYKVILFFLLSLSFVWLGCADSSKKVPSRDDSVDQHLDGKQNQEDANSASQKTDPFADDPDQKVGTHPISPEETRKDLVGPLEQRLIDAGLVDIKTLDPEIVVDLKYATEDNFMDQNVYGELRRCYMQKDAAEMLVQAQINVREADSSLSLIVFDGVRPRSVQRKMWAIVKGTDQQKYVAPPGGTGSMHNYGAAVDLSLVDANGELVDMGTPYDFFGPLAQPRYEDKYMKEGKLTKKQLQSRWLLRKAMRKAGFHMIMSEWWHFNSTTRALVSSKYEVVE